MGEKGETNRKKPHKEPQIFRAERDLESCFLIWPTQNLPGPDCLGCLLPSCAIEKGY